VTELLLAGAVPDLHVDAWPQAEDDMDDAELDAVVAVGVRAPHGVEKLKGVLLAGASLPEGYEKRKGVQQAHKWLVVNGLTENNDVDDPQLKANIAEVGKVLREHKGNVDGLPADKKAQSVAVAEELRGLLKKSQEENLPQLPSGRKKTNKGGPHNAQFPNGTRVEVSFDDGLWYQGEVVGYKEETGEYLLYFPEDGDDLTIKIPDDDVKLLK